MIKLQDGSLDEAIHELSQAEQICHDLGDRRGVAECAYRLGTAALSRDNLDQAATNLNRAADLLHGIGDRRSEAYTNLALGRLHQKMGQPRRAREFLNSALRTFTTSGNPKGTEQAHEALASLGG